MVSAVNDYFLAKREVLEGYLTELSGRVVMPSVLRTPLERAMRSAGKRIRGLLVIAVAESSGLRAGKVLDAAAAFELIHTSSLILDDLPSMDDAALRRGEPTLHRAFGEDLAILSAVALLNHAYGMIAHNHAALSPRRWPGQQVVQRVVDAVGWDGSIGGQAVDLHSDAATLDFATLEYIHSRKTGALFVASAAVGGMLANVPGPMLARLEAYAKNLGLAFQITDDVLDVTASAETLGKDVGKDEQKLTFVRLAGVDGARQLAAELIETSISAIAPLGAKGEHLRDLALIVRDRAR